MTEDDVLKLTIDEYRRGVVSWRVAGQAVVRVRVPDEDGADGDWSIPLTNHHGSLSPVRFSPGVQIGIVPSDSVTLNQPIRVRWHALVEQEAVTAIWDALDSPPVLLSGVPDFGHFYRMTVTTPWLTWEEEATVWEGSTTLSFRRLPELGQIWVPTEPTEPGQLPRQLEVVPSVVNRGTIEIVTPGAPPGQCCAGVCCFGIHRTCDR